MKVSFFSLLFTGSLSGVQDILSHVQWSTLRASQNLLRQLLAAFIGQDPLVIGIDETLERRWGLQIKARGIYRDAVRSSGSHFVKCSGLRWISVLVLTKVSWAKRLWALPFLTALAPSERYYDDTPRPHKKLTDWARQLLLLVKRWVGERQVVAVGDSSYAVIDLLKALQGQVSLISRLRLDAALCEPVPLAAKGQRGVSGSKAPGCPHCSRLPKTTRPIGKTSMSLTGMVGKPNSSSNVQLQPYGTTRAKSR